MAKAQANNPFTEAFKTFGDFKYPGVDFKNLFSVQRRNIEAFSAANQVVTESFQALARRQAEIFQENTQEALQLAKEIFSAGGNPEAATTKQTEYLRNLVESGISNLRELLEVTSKSSIEAFDVINKRVAESVSELAEAAETKESKK